jgi:NADH-quinone oxidoreductase subunit H
MAFGWKVLIPVALAWTVLVATLRTINLQGGVDRQYLLIGAGVMAAIFVALMFVGDRGEEAEPTTETGPHDAFAGGYPVPPLPAGGPVRGPAKPLTFDRGSTVRTPGSADADEPSDGRDTDG